MSTYDDDDMDEREDEFYQERLTYTPVQRGMAKTMGITPKIFELDFVEYLEGLKKRPLGLDDLPYLQSGEELLLSFLIYKRLDVKGLDGRITTRQVACLVNAAEATTTLSIKHDLPLIDGWVDDAFTLATNNDHPELTHSVGEVGVTLLNESQLTHNYPAMVRILKQLDRLSYDPHSNDQDLEGGPLYGTIVQGHEDCFRDLRRTKFVSEEVLESLLDGLEGLVDPEEGYRFQESLVRTGFVLEEQLRHLRAEYDKEKKAVVGVDGPVRFFGELYYEAYKKADKKERAQMADEVIGDLEFLKMGIPTFGMFEGVKKSVTKSKKSKAKVKGKKTRTQKKEPKKSKKQKPAQEAVGADVGNALEVQSDKVGDAQVEAPQPAPSENIFDKLLNNPAALAALGQKAQQWIDDDMKQKKLAGEVPAALKETLGKLEELLSHKAVATPLIPLIASNLMEVAREQMVELLKKQEAQAALMASVRMLVDVESCGVAANVLIPQYALVAQELLEVEAAVKPSRKMTTQLVEAPAEGHLSHTRVLCEMFIRHSVAAIGRRLENKTMAHG